MKSDNPYDPFRVDITHVYGREEILQNLKGDLNTGLSCAVVGGRRIGKTTILRRLERDLLLNLNETINKGIVLIPIYIDLLSIEKNTPLYLYKELAGQIFQNLVERNLLREQRGQDIESIHNYENEESRFFRELLSGWIADVSHKALLKIAVIFDEVGVIANTAWGEGFFSNWRYLLNNARDLSSNVCAVFAGANEMRELSQNVGSPLANILVWRALQTLSWKDSRNLVQEPCSKKMSDKLARKIYLLTGGHPFLIQFIMQKMCASDDSADENILDAACTDFGNTQATQFQQWASTFEATDREVYAFLAARSRPQKKRELIPLVGDTAANFAVSTLSHTGVIVKVGEKDDERYRVAGYLFREWFVRNLSSGIKPSGLDSRIYDKLEKLDTVLATKYMTAWSIHHVRLENYSGCVSEMRDVITLLLHKLAPDEEIKQNPGYVPEKDSNGKELAAPTRRQRVSFIARKRNEKNNLDNEVDFFDSSVDLLGNMVKKAYGQASAKTHTIASDEQAWKCLKQMDSILAQLL